MTLRTAARAMAASALAAVALLGLASPAAAGDLWVDDGGNDILNGCTFPSNPCDTIAYTITQATMNADPTDTIHVGGGSYPEPLTLPPGVSLLKDNWPPLIFTTAGAATIDGGADPGVTVPQGLPARSISGNFILRGNDDGTPSEGSVLITSGANPGNVTISGATFNESGIPSQLVIQGGSPKVLDSTFTGVDDNMFRTAIRYDGTGTPEIGGNTITTFFTGIAIQESAAPGFPIANLHDNVITEIFETAGIPAGIRITGGSGEITANEIRGKAGETLGHGVTVTGAATGTPLEFARNRIYDIPGGINLANADATSFSSDVIANTGVGLSMYDNAAGVTASGLTVTHSTSVVNREIYLDDTALTLNSSIVGDQGVEFAVGTASCASTFSRGPAVPDNCGFATAADPMFADPAMDDFHLMAGSSMIDAGDPAAPQPGELDIDGDARAYVIPAGPSCLPPPPAPRRDIGADEFTTYAVPGIGCPLPIGNPPQTPAGPTKKCEKKRKGAKGKRGTDASAAAKRKGCKKRKKKR